MAPPALINDGDTVQSSPQAPAAKTSGVLHRSLHKDPHTVVAAQGLYLTLSSGRKVLDATGGAAVSCLGHGNARVKAAMVKQIDAVSYCHSLIFSTAAAEELADELCKGTGGEMTRVFIINSGEASFSRQNCPDFAYCRKFQYFDSLASRKVSCP
jgi:adenosylmethionine-8-amino-7-oxononanoate aminotransferase